MNKIIQVQVLSSALLAYIHYPIQMTINIAYKPTKCFGCYRDETDNTKSVYLSSTLPEIDPDTAYVVCISVSLGFRQKPSDTALLSVIALTTFNSIVSASVTKGALVCFVLTVHWWRHRTHYDVKGACRALRSILTVHLNNGATRADLRGIPTHYEVTAIAVR